MDTTALAHEEPPRRPDAGPGQALRERRWLPTFGLLATILVLVLGGFVVAAGLSEPAGPPAEIPGLVSVQPLTGWQVAGQGTIGNQPARSYVQLTRGSGNLIVVDWGLVSGDAGSLAQAVVDDVLRPNFDQLSVSDSLSQVTSAEGQRGQRFTFVGVDPKSGTSVEGEVTAFTDASGRGVVFIGLAPEGLLAYVDGDLHAMIDRAQVR